MKKKKRKNQKMRKTGIKAKRTGIWAKIMTKWFIRYTSKGKKIWQIVSFEGKKGGESRGIVDIIAIKNEPRIIKNALGPKKLKNNNIITKFAQGAESKKDIVAAVEAPLLYNDIAIAKIP